MKRNVARVIAFLLIIAMLAGTGFYLVYMIADGDTSYTVYAAPNEGELAYQRLDELKNVIDYINNNYKDTISVKTLVDGAYEGVFNKLDDWSVYYSTVEEEQSFTSQLESGETYTGIGVTLSKDAGRLMVESVNVNGPAREAGIHYGDCIVSVDGKTAAPGPLNPLRTHIAGPQEQRSRSGSNAKASSLLSSLSEERSSLPKWMPRSLTVPISDTSRSQASQTECTGIS